MRHIVNRRRLAYATLARGKLPARTDESYNLPRIRLSIQTARRLIEEHEDEIKDAWHKHFGN